MTDALKRRGLITVRKVELTKEQLDFVYALWRIDLTPEGRRIRDSLLPMTEQYSFPAYPAYLKSECAFMTRSIRSVAGVAR